MSLLTSVSLLSGFGSSIPIVDVDSLPSFLERLVSETYPDLRAISVEIWNNPEVGRNESFAHNVTVDFFNKHGGFQVFPTILKSLPTAWKIEFSHRPAHWPKDASLPTIGFISEYDALEGIGHACGHNHIWLQGVYAASLTRQALIHYDIPAHIVLVGTPDEEESCGKHTLFEAGIFEESLVWLMAHPTIANAVQPMSSRENIVTRIIKDTHFEAVKAVYNILVPIKNLTTFNLLPGTSSTAAIIEDVGMFVCNVVQADIALGVVGASITTVNDTINAIKSANSGYATTNFTLATDPNMEGGVAIMFDGNAGHAASNNLGALDLSVDTFQALNASNPDLEFYLPDNTTSSELDFTVDCRTRYTTDLNGLVDFVLGFIPTKNVTTDVIYPALEPDPFLGPLFVDTIALPQYGSQDWPISTIAPAATDASWVQLAKLGQNHTLESVHKGVLHANYNICNISVCAFNHEPGFRLLAGMDFAYEQTEIIGRAIAQVAVELLNDPELMAGATKNIHAGPHLKT